MYVCPESKIIDTGIAVGISYAGSSDVEAALHRLLETEIVTG
jgi:hypothetical protein